MTQVKTDFRADTEQAFKELDDSTLHILEIPVGEVKEYVPVVREKGVAADKASRAEILDLDGRHDRWRERAMEAEDELLALRGPVVTPGPVTEPISPPPKRKLSDMSVRYGEDVIAGLPLSAQPFARMGAGIVAAEVLNGNGYTEALRTMQKERHGRGVMYPTAAMLMFTSLTGWDGTGFEAFRMLQIVRAGLLDTNGDGFLNLLWDSLSTKDTNEKEEGLGWCFFTECVYILWVNGKSNKSWAEMAEWALDFLLKHVVAKWMKWKGKVWPQSYIIHPALAACLSLHRMYLMTGDGRFKAALEAFAAEIIKEFVYTKVGGREMVLWSFNSRTLSPDKKALIEPQQFHMSVYAFKVCQYIRMLAFAGVKPFASQRLLNALAVTMELGLLQGPYTVTRKDGTKFTAATNKDIGGQHILTLQEGKEQDKKRAVEIGGREFVDCWWDAGRFFRSDQSMLGFPGASMFAFETGTYLKDYYGRVLGTPEKPRQRGSMTVGNWFEMASNEVYRQGGYTI